MGGCLGHKGPENGPYRLVFWGFWWVIDERVTKGNDWMGPISPKALIRKR